MDMDIQYGYGYAIWIWIYNMDMDMQYGYVLLFSLYPFIVYWNKKCIHLWMDRFVLKTTNKKRNDIFF